MRHAAIALLLAAGLAHAQGQSRPYIGYLCAAGGQRGTVVRVVAGGQNLRGAREVFVSGEGVQATVIRHQRVPWLLKPDDRRVVAQQLRRLATKRKAKEPVTLPDHPMLKNLDGLTPKELRRVAYEFLDPARRSQLSPQIAETVELEIKIDARARLGDRELRIRTPRGLTNPVLFQVGAVRELLEVEPNDYAAAHQPIQELPCVLNGRVTFKDIDHFRFRARKGQQLVVEVLARRLVPYVADAVPGWFQATLALYDSRGKEIAFADDYRFDPDPVHFFEVPADGEYVLEVRDAIYRGRDDFVYRITVAERPWIMAMFPLGGRAGSDTIAEVLGWNLPWRRFRLDTKSGDEIRDAARARGDLLTNPVPYAVDKLHERKEIEPNDLRAAAQRVNLSMILNGRISDPRDVDVFRFQGRKGQSVVAEVTARRLGSPMDSLVRLIDDAGVVLAYNDDHEDKRAGLVTHQADSYLRATLPATGTYYVQVSDAQGHGGDAHVYRLRLSTPRPDFALIVTPASINVRSGTLVPVTVHAVRLDGFDGPIDVALGDAPPGFALSGTHIPPGRDKIRMTLAAPPRRPGGPPIPLEIVGRARVGRRKVEREAVPAEDMMQAFGLRHLVPAQRLLVDLLRPWRRTKPLHLEDQRPRRLRAGGTVEVKIQAQGLPPLDRLSFQLSDAPPCVTLKEVRAERGGLVLVLSAAYSKTHIGYADNLIIEAYALVPVGDKNKKPRPTRRFFAGVLPAIPFEIVDG